MQALFSKALFSRVFFSLVAYAVFFAPLGPVSLTAFVFGAMASSAWFLLQRRKNMSQMLSFNHLMSASAVFGAFPGSVAMYI
jgi:hypothetical protein